MKTQAETEVRQPRGGNGWGRQEPEKQGGFSVASGGGAAPPAPGVQASGLPVTGE